MTDLDRLIRSIRITAGYDDPVLMSAKQVFALTSEVLHLREHRESCVGNLLKGYETGKTEERAAVVAWLRGKFPQWPAGTNGYADEVERGEHRREVET